MKRSDYSQTIERKLDWSSQYLSKGTSTDKGVFRWWYSLSAPPVPPASAPFHERETARRGRLTSIVLFFFILLIVVIGVPVRVIQDPSEIFLLIALAFPLLLAMWFNRRGYVNVSGLIVVIVLTMGLTLVLTVFQSHGLSVNSVALYDITIQTVLFSVSLLPAPMVFVAATYNCVFIILDYLLLPHTPDLTALVALSGPDVLVRPISLNLSVAIITYLWVSSATRALKRADRAEVIAKLEHDLVQQTRIVINQKEQLDVSIEQIMQTLTRAANGDLDARTPLTNENVLWEVVGAINNLLARFQRSHQIEKEVEQLQARLQWTHQIEYQLKQFQQEKMYTQREIKNQLLLLRAAKSTHGPLHFKPTQTHLDPLLAELNGYYLVRKQ